jgi:RNA polymerase sigma-70 factor (ECF subfamily)
MPDTLPHPPPARKDLPLVDPPAPDPDRSLFDRLRAGDFAHFDAFVDRYKNRLFRYLLSRVDSVHTAEDLTQEVFLKTLRNPPASDPASAGRASTWLFTVARNCLTDHHRATQRHARLQPALLDARPLPSSLDPAGAAIAEEERLRLTALLANLPDDQREALSLRLLADLSIPEIAAITNVPIPTVKSRLKYALEKIARTLPASLKESRHD